MVTLYTFTTPNGRKISVMLEELGVPYQVKVIDLSKNEQFDPAYLRISPNNKIPAIIDDDESVDAGPIALFESGAILIYLAEKYGKFLPTSGLERYRTLEWLSWQIGGIGPFFGQLGHFGIFADERLPYPISRYTREAERLLTVLDTQLNKYSYIAGDEYTIADIAAYPWVATAGTLLKDFLGDFIAEKPAIQRWLTAVGDRPAVRRGMEIPHIPSNK